MVASTNVFINYKTSFFYKFIGKVANDSLYKIFVYCDSEKDLVYQGLNLHKTFTDISFKYTY